MTSPAPGRRALTPFSAAPFVLLAWLALMLAGQRWDVFGHAWPMTLTMIAGSFIAGATSEGGGAVAFPVMTLALKIPPPTARDFALMIQTVGMNAAALAIWRMKIPVEGRAIVSGSIGGAVGVVLGIEVISPLLAPVATKMFFVSFWLSFALALYLINRDPARHTLARIEAFGPRSVALLASVGVLGGAISGITGSGLDITLFAVLVLGFRLDERVATPTSVVLMGLNAAVGFLWSGTLGARGLAPAAWDYWWASVPVVVFGAPLGAWFIAGKSRRLVAGFLYLSIFTQYAAALLLLPLDARLVGFSAATLAGGVSLFGLVAWAGRRRLPPPAAPSG